VSYNILGLGLVSVFKTEPTQLKIA